SLLASLLPAAWPRGWSFDPVLISLYHKRGFLFRQNRSLLSVKTPKPRLPKGAFYGAELLPHRGPEGQPPGGPPGLAGGGAGHRGAVRRLSPPHPAGAGRLLPPAGLAGRPRGGGRRRLRRGAGAAALPLH